MKNFIYTHLLIMILISTILTNSTKTIFNCYSQIQSLSIDNFTGMLYIGITNKLIQLDRDLKMVTFVDTGPRWDNPNCPPPPTDECHCSGNSCSDFEKSNMNSVSKSLIIDYKGNQVIGCSNLYQGHCIKYNLMNISETDGHIYPMIVPNDEKSSIIMYIAPGLFSNLHNHTTDVLYVAASRSTKGMPAYKDNVPTISVRNLKNFTFISDDMLTPSRIETEVQQRDVFKVTYKYGFSSLSFSYFISIQKQSAISDSDHIVTRLSRICQADRSLYSYTELSLNCYEVPTNPGSQGKQFNVLKTALIAHAGPFLATKLGLSHLPPLSDNEHILFTIFSHVNESGGTGQEGGSALCIYPMSNVRRIFTETIQRCFQGIGNTGPDHFVQPIPCLSTKFEITDDYCGQHDINHPIKGTDPVQANAIKIWPQDEITAISVAIINNVTVALLGTSNGRIKKLRIDNIDNEIYAHEYAEENIDNRYSVLQNMHYDIQHEHLYTAIGSTVYKLSLQICSQHTTCMQCLLNLDPHCGWCNHLQKCTIKKECPKSNDPRIWVTENRCPKIINIVSNQTQRQPGNSSMIIMTVDYLPPFQTNVSQCIFTGQGLVRKTFARIKNIATDRNTIEVRCETPQPNLLPTFPTGKDHIIMLLTLTSDGVDHVATNFTFFDCSLHNTCMKCTVSRFPCTWCMENNKCTANKEECLKDVLITGQHVPGNSDTPGPEFCPRILNINDSGGLLVPSGSEIRLKIKVEHLQAFQDNFRCMFNFNGGIEEIKHADLELPDTIVCHSQLFSYPGTSNFINVPFQILWGEGKRKIIDNPFNAQVRIYKCEMMGLNCGRCRGLNPQLKCGWCVQTGESKADKIASCTQSSECQASSGLWMNSKSFCSDPSIINISPLSGPIGGGTIINIIGENLGMSEEDTVANIAGLPCHIFYYEPGVKIKCNSTISETALSGPLSLNIGGIYTTFSQDSFSYVVPILTSLTPTQAPLSGGSIITIYGQFLDCGSFIVIFFMPKIGPPIPCFWIMRTWTFITCKLSGSTHPGVVQQVIVTIDKYEINFLNGEFLLVDDPVVKNVTSLKSIISGGTLLRVMGLGFNLILEPLLIVYNFRNENVTSICHNKTNILLLCPIPDLKLLLKQDFRLVKREAIRDIPSPTLLNFGFIMDDVMNVKNISANGGRQLEVYGDPIFEIFDEANILPSKTNYITINGENINNVLGLNDFQVFVGESNCLVTSLTSTQIICLPNQPHLISNKAHVYIIVGNSTQFDLGIISYNGGSGFHMTLPFLAGIGGTALVLIIVIVAVCAAYRAKSRENDKVLRKMNNKMNVLEARVAKECKEAFAELQTDVTSQGIDTYGNRASIGGIPFRHYQDFCVRVLFPHISSGPGCAIGSLGDQRGALVSIMLAPQKLFSEMEAFGQLLENRNFLLLFIRTLESKSDFIVREKVTFASLLSIALQPNMIYHTEILQCLLSELIEKVMDKRNLHPKLLLRRTESVVEKMLTNWFTLLLYNTLETKVGEPLYYLFQAIKRQVDKGPVDALTSEAKYSLSEEKLIRQEVEYRIINLQVICHDDLMHHSNEEINETNEEAESLLKGCGKQVISVKVLDCDTITQAKEKILDTIYVRFAWSARPKSQDIDLEWITGPANVGGKLILRDEDVTTKYFNDVFKINTLGHYRVNDNALVSLVNRKEKLSLDASLSNKFNSLPLNSNRSPSHTLISSAASNTNNYNKAYHLVKQDDSDNHKEDQTSKIVSEVYLTRLLATKVTLQKFVDDLFKKIFECQIDNNEKCQFPIPIKYMFDFFDEQALHYNITDPEVVHTWKSNSLPLRFWVNIVKNPDFVFDISKSNIVDSCLSVIGQTFMDACSMAEHKLTKDSPSSKLLYAKDIPNYKLMVQGYYDEIKRQPCIGKQQIDNFLRTELKDHENDFNTQAALSELYQYALKYQHDLLKVLEEDEACRKEQLADKFRLIKSTQQFYI